jgi:glycosyltransferase involved in cell wall biosynthesis
VRTLFVSPRQCWPVLSGAKLREFHFARALGQRGPLTYLYFSDPGQAPLTTRELPFCDRVVAVPKPEAYGALQLVQGLLTRWPLPILNYSSPAMEAAVRRLTSEQAYDLVHFDSIHMIRYGAALPGKRIVYNWHNIESEAMQRYSQTVTSAPRRWYAQRTAAKIARLEQEILHTGFGHIVCSERERIQLLQLQPEARIGVVDNGVDVDYFQGAFEMQPPAAVNAQAGPRLVFVGTMDYYPNVEAATSFTRNIWPRLRERQPELRLWIVGAKPTPAVQALGGRDGITVTGTVDDVRPYYGGALAAIVPLRTGGGTRLKILEAMAAGVPVISTPIGAEGLEVTPGRDILMADPDDAAMWSAHVDALATALARREALCASALELMRSRYDWTQLGRQLGDFYERWLPAS